MNFNGSFNSNDPLKIFANLTKPEITVMEIVRDFAQTQIKPLINEAFFNENKTVELVKLLGQLKMYGGEIAYRFGGPEISPVAYGLIAYELERVDSGLRTAYSVTGGLCMKSIDLFGSEEHKQQYLDKLNDGTISGSFGLTENICGSDISNLHTTSVKTTDGYLINGTKRWIGLAPYADILIIWAKCEDNLVRGFIVEKNSPGLTIEPIKNKISLRSIVQGEINLNNVKVSLNNVLPKSKGLSSAFACLNHARYGIAWGALGAAQDCLDTALIYTKQRSSFGVSLAGKQLVQEKLVKMQVEIALGLAACLQVGRLIEQNAASFFMINLLKYNSSVKALEIARSARDLLGGNGILADYSIMRHMVNLESVVTYEGTKDVHILTLGRELTGISAF